MKNTNIVLLALALSFFGLTSCGDDSSGNSGGNTPTVTVMDSIEDLSDANVSSVGSADFSGENNYSVSGKAELFLHEDSGSYSLVLSNFQSSGGPDLKVYLSEDNGISNFVSLGELKSTNGTLRYDFGADQYNASFKNVLIWCEEFTQNFGTATFP